MQRQSENQIHNTARSRAGAITFYTLLCFSLAGLIMGFGIGGFASHLTSTSAGGADAPTTSEPMLTGHSPHQSGTNGPENIFLGAPNIGPGSYISPETADGSTRYQLSTQIVNKADQTPITATDVVCRLWLASDLQETTAGLSTDNFAIPRNPGSFNQPFPSEVTGALSFTPSTSQTQPCAANGKTQWSYTLSSTVPHGTYYLAVLADWKGIHYNWYMVAVTVNNANNTGD